CCTASAANMRSVLAQSWSIWLYVWDNGFIEFSPRKGFVIGFSRYSRFLSRYSRTFSRYSRSAW
ncbi:MAG: hypothetical protein U9Q82_04515, partial [Chloroflexota bacterium]|nr:hypothetical protein [Chloroflexota bacterium]